MMESFLIFVFFFLSEIGRILLWSLGLPWTQNPARALINFFFLSFGLPQTEYDNMPREEKPSTNGLSVTNDRV